MKDNHNHKVSGVAEPTHLGQHSHQFAVISDTCRYVGGNHLHKIILPPPLLTVTGTPLRG